MLLKTTFLFLQSKGECYKNNFADCRVISCLFLHDICITMWRVQGGGSYILQHTFPEPRYSDRIMLQYKIEKFFDFSPFQHFLLYQSADVSVIAPQPLISLRGKRTVGVREVVTIKDEERKGQG